MTAHLVLRQIIQKKQSTNTRLSLRWIAAKVGISSGRLSEILNAKRPLTEYYADKICMALKLTDEETRQIKKALDTAYPTGPTLPDEVLAQITDSKPFALLCFFQTNIYAETAKAFPSHDTQLTQISQLMQIPAPELTSLLKLLNTLRVIEWTQQRWTLTADSALSSYDNPNKTNPHGHISDLQLIQKTSQGLSIFERDISSLTLTMDPKHIAKAKKMIRDFKRDFAESMKKGQPKGVFQISIQLLPLIAVKRHIDIPE